jgi:hypothetical protein
MFKDIPSNTECTISDLFEFNDKLKIIPLKYLSSTGALSPYNQGVKIIPLLPIVEFLA